MAFAFLFSMAFSVTISYFMGQTVENNKTMYKCVREEVDEALQEEDDNICADGYVYYAIVDEQPDRYIVCVLDVKTTDENEKYIINTARKKIIQNTGVEVFDKEVSKK
mgnify:FL=1